MPGVHATTVKDLLEATLRESKDPPGFTLIAQELQEYPVMASAYQKGRVKMLEGTYGYHGSLMDMLDDVAAHDGIFGVDDVHISDYLTGFHTDFIQAKTHFALNRQIILMNRGKNALADLAHAAKVNAMLSLAKQMEAKAHRLRGVNDTLDPNGIPYHIVWNATKGFTGGAPSGHTLVNGVNPTDHPHYKNYSDTYVDVIFDDLILKLIEASMRCHFTTPIVVKQAKQFMDNRVVYMVNMATYLRLKILQRNQENKSGDLDASDNILRFRGNPILWVPQFETIGHASGSDPIYCIDYKHLFPMALVGDLFAESEPMYDGSNHNNVKVFYDISYNYTSINRKNLAILAKADPWP